MALKISKMLNYLYYKLYRASLQSSLKDIPALMAPMFLGGLISSNLLVINTLLSKLDIFPFLFRNDLFGTYFTLIVIVANLMYFHKKRIKSILNRYSNESDKERVRGNILVGIYVAISFLSIFAVAFYKPGYLS